MATLIEGAKLVLGGREFIVPPLNFKALRALTPKLGILAGLGAVPTSEQFDVVVDLVHAALTRNYPDMGKDELEELLDLGNLSTALEAVMGASGMVRGGEVESPGVNP